MTAPISYKIWINISLQISITHFFFSIVYFMCYECACVPFPYCAHTGQKRASVPPRTEGHRQLWAASAPNFPAIAPTSFISLWAVRHGVNVTTIQKTRRPHPRPYSLKSVSPSNAVGWELIVSHISLWERDTFLKHGSSYHSVWSRCSLPRVVTSTYSASPRKGRCLYRCVVVVAVAAVWLVGCLVVGWLIGFVQKIMLNSAWLQWGASKYQLRVHLQIGKLDITNSLHFSFKKRRKCALYVNSPNAWNWTTTRFFKKKKITMVWEQDKSFL